MLFQTRPSRPQAGESPAVPGSYNSPMLLSWLRARRRRKLIAEPFPIRWSGFLERNVGHYARLSEPEQARVRDVMRVLIAEKNWLGRGGLFISEEMTVTIAAQAALLLIGDDRGYYRRVRDIVVFPTTFRTPVAEDDWEDDELSDTISSGQAVDRGPVLLAWDQVLPEGARPGRRVQCRGPRVRPSDSTSAIDSRTGLRPWGIASSSRAGGMCSRWPSRTIRRAIKEKAEGLFFTPHAADSPAEFFADATEAFYCRPLDLRDLHAELYQLLAAYYRLDPAAWFEGGR